MRIRGVSARVCVCVCVCLRACTCACVRGFAIVSSKYARAYAFAIRVSLLSDFLLTLIFAVLIERPSKEIFMHECFYFVLFSFLFFLFFFLFYFFLFCFTCLLF